MGLVVLGLDALDAGLVEHFDADPLRLQTHGDLETFAFMQDVPYTPEVWPTIATGLHPREHGVYSSGTSKWNNPVVDFLSTFTGRLPTQTRARLGNLATRWTGARYGIGETSKPTVFDGRKRVVHNWPGVANGEEIVKVWQIPNPDERQSVWGFERDLRGIGIQHFAWAREMLAHDVGLAGVHDHTLDMGGHVYARDEPRLRALYDWVGEQVTAIESALGPDDELLLVSDHGMVTAFYSENGDRGNEPASHSWRAYAASTTDSVPETVFDVAEWIERHVEEASQADEETIDVPEEQLRNLGYM